MLKSLDIMSEDHPQKMKQCCQTPLNTDKWPKSMKKMCFYDRRPYCIVRCTAYHIEFDSKTKI